MVILGQKNAGYGTHRSWIKQWIILWYLYGHIDSCKCNSLSLVWFYNFVHGVEIQNLYFLQNHAIPWPHCPRGPAVTGGHPKNFLRVQLDSLDCPRAVPYRSRVSCNLKNFYQFWNTSIQPEALLHLYEISSWILISFAHLSTLNNPWGHSLC
jgi:hypothetical protein